MDDLLRDSRSHFGRRYDDRGAVTEASPAFKLEEETDRPALLLRPADKNDVAFILDTWLDCHARRNRGQSVITLYKMHRPIIERLLEESFTYVACNQQVTDQIYAYACARRYQFDIMGKSKSLLIAHWAYTKHTFRGFGIARTLFERVYGYRPGKTVLYTHNSRNIKRLKDNHNLEYAPLCQTPEGIEEYLEHYVAERIKHWGGHRGRKGHRTTQRRKRG